VQGETIPVPSEAVQACFKIIGLFRTARAYLLALYKKTTAVDNGCGPEDKGLLYIVIRWFLKDNTVRENN
jgi:hypothetical protein